MLFQLSIKNCGPGLPHLTSYERAMVSIPTSS